MIEAIVREHHAGLRAFVRSLGVEEAWVDDVAQETFLVAYRKMDDWDPERCAGRWLRGIARHLAANERRKEARRSRLLHDGLADLLAGAATDSPTPVAELLSALHGCMQELPADGRALLQRRYAEGETAEAIAAEHQGRADAIRQRLLRLRLLVKRCVERKQKEAWA